MRTKIQSKFLLFALIICLSFAITACKSDKRNTNTDNTEKRTDKSETVSGDSITDKGESATDKGEATTDKDGNTTDKVDTTTEDTQQTAQLSSVTATENDLLRMDSGFVIPAFIQTRESNISGNKVSSTTYFEYNDTFDLISKEKYNNNDKLTVSEEYEYVNHFLTKYVYNDMKNDANSYQILYTYNTIGQVIKDEKIQSNGRTTTNEYQYNSEGLVIKKEISWSNDTRRAVVEYEYSDNNKTVIEKDENLTKIYKYDDYGNQIYCNVNASSEAHISTDYKYKSSGNYVKKTVTTWNADGTANGKPSVYIYEYDDFDCLQKSYKEGLTDYTRYTFKATGVKPETDTASGDKDFSDMTPEERYNYYMGYIHEYPRDARWDTYSQFPGVMQIAEGMFYAGMTYDEFVAEVEKISFPLYVRYFEKDKECAVRFNFSGDKNSEETVLIANFITVNEGKEQEAVLLYNLKLKKEVYAYRSYESNERVNLDVSPIVRYSNGVSDSEINTITYANKEEFLDNALAGSDITYNIIDNNSVVSKKDKDLVAHECISVTVQLRFSHYNYDTAEKYNKSFGIRLGYYEGEVSADSGCQYVFYFDKVTGELVQKEMSIFPKDGFFGYSTLTKMTVDKLDQYDTSQVWSEFVKFFEANTDKFTFGQLCGPGELLISYDYDTHDKYLIFECDRMGQKKYTIVYNVPLFVKNYNTLVASYTDSKSVYSKSDIYYDTKEELMDYINSNNYRNYDFYSYQLVEE